MPDRQPRYLASTNPDEQFANAFAMELLMPTEAVLHMRAAHMSIEQMADVFDVPVDVMTIRVFALAQIGGTV